MAVLYLIGVLSATGCALAPQWGGSIQGAIIGGLLGALAGAATKYVLTGDRPGLGEGVQDALITGLFVASADATIGLWQPPTEWNHLFCLTRFTASMGCAAYLIVVLYSMARTRRHVSLRTGACMVGAPYLFNWLLLLQSPSLLREMAGLLPFVHNLSQPVVEGMGRGITLLVFNEAVAGSIHLSLTGRWIKETRLHILLFFSAVVSVMGPSVADLGAGSGLLAWPRVFGSMASLISTIVSQAGLWAQIYLLTGIIMDSLHDKKPSWYWGAEHYTSGMMKGAVYSGVFMGLLHAVSLILSNRDAVSLLAHHAQISFILMGAAGFPFLRTIMESFDDSEGFFKRLSRNYREPLQSLRGALIGLGCGLGVLEGMPAAESGTRFIYGFFLGAAAYGGVDLIRDACHIWVTGRRERFQSGRIYLLGLVLGGLVGGALAWYLDGAQMAVIQTKFHHYTAIHYRTIGESPEPYVIYPFFSKWGALNLGEVSGGSRLLYNEALSGVINWSLAAPLFSINLIVLTAIFRRNLRPIRHLFTRDGVVNLMEQAVRVQRWGLWMAPVIYSFLRMSPDPTWYNQDGAIRTISAIVKRVTLGSEAFRTWSLTLFTYLLAFDWLRILIWVDHMGLRVATLVNLSFVGGDLVDEKAARYIGYNSRAHCLPEGIRRFATWGPLLIPFYLPRGREWDLAWTQSAAIQRSLVHTTISPQAVILSGFLFIAMGAALVLGLRHRNRGALSHGKRHEWNAPCGGSGEERAMVLTNGVYTLDLMGDGRGYSRVFSFSRRGSEIDLTRRVDDPMQLCGRGYYLLDAERPDGDPSRVWSLSYNPIPQEDGDYKVIQPSEDCVRFETTFNGIRAETEVYVADMDPVEVWLIRLTNLKDQTRHLELTSYREFTLNSYGVSISQNYYNSMHIGTWFVRSLNAIFAVNRLLKDHRRDATKRRLSNETAFHAVKEGPEGPGGTARLIGYEDSRPHFIGSGTLRKPLALRKALRDPEDEGLLYTFDPIASLRVRILVRPKGIVDLVFVDGYGANQQHAARLVEKYLGLPEGRGDGLGAALKKRRLPHRNHIRHGIGQAPIFSFSDDGTELYSGWETPQPWAHILANELGYGAVISNDGNIYSFMGNSQQNGLTRPHTDSMPAQIPGQVVYLMDLSRGKPCSPTYVPLRATDGQYHITYGRGYVLFRQRTDDMEISLTVFVLPDQTAEIRLLRIRNARREPVIFRVVTYFHMVLGETASDTRGKIEACYDEAIQTLFFSNPQNAFHKGWAFLATSLQVEMHETVRSRFVGGPERDLGNPYMLEHGLPDRSQRDDGLRIASLVGTVTVPGGGEETISFVFGQTADRQHAGEIVKAYQDAGAAAEALERTRQWWRERLSVLRVETNAPAFDRLVNDWLPYQTLVSRLWGRCGLNQRGGAYGFRDQLQDVLPFLTLRPDMARSQILLHAAQQCLEGDAMQWWHQTWDGKTGLGARNRASDPHLWLPYLVYRYVNATGDWAILDERVPFLEVKAIPRGTEGHVVIPRSSRENRTLYEHCIRAITFSLKRMGRDGIPLIGTGDWNDGLNAIGFKGRGQSVWLGFFLYDILTNFTRIMGWKKDLSQRDHYLKEAKRLRKALDGMRRGDRYVRAITDDGQEMDFADALMAAWPALSGAVDFEKAAPTVESGLRDLEKDRQILLLNPPFTEDSNPYPGRLADYPPGVRENGGQYSHGVSWMVDALVLLAEMAEQKGLQDLANRYRDKAVEVWMNISPIMHMTPEVIGIYGLPPHQQAPGIYNAFGYEGHGGWSWYTGAAGRMLSAAYAILGLKMEDGRLLITDGLWMPKGRLRLKGLVYKGKVYANNQGGV